METLELDTTKWAEQEFGQCNLGDVRRTRRLVQFAAAVAANPDGSTPQQLENWANLKAAYRLVGKKDVTFSAVAERHWQATKACPPGMWLILCDTTEVNFGRDNEAEGLGPLGEGTGRGFLLHSGLMVQPESNEVRGLAGQIIRHRRPAPKDEKVSQRLSRDRESVLWGQLFEQVGRPPEGVRYVDVCDRGADDFEAFCRLLFQGHDWVIRASKMNRTVISDGLTMPLADFLPGLPELGEYVLEFRSHKDGQRKAKIKVSAGTVLLRAPQHRSPWLKEVGIASLAMNAIVVREVNPPKGVEPLYWVLFTSLPTSTFEEAVSVIGYYEQRATVEEFHKALKMGCCVQERQYEKSHRLEVIAGLMSVVAVRLLRLRSVARTAPETPALEVVPRRWVTVLSCLRGKKIGTAREFYRHLAGLGGHLMRKGDGEPGWITLWRGFAKLHIAVRAIQAYDKRCG